ncbi:uncharacterized protein sowahb [Polymixia lowei]
MASSFSQDSVLHFIQRHGGSVKNSELLLHFKPFLHDDASRTQRRELFKSFVNSVATVKQQDGVSYVVLRKKFRGHVGGDGRNPPPAAGQRDRSPKTGNRNPTRPSPQGCTETASLQQKAPQRESTTHAPRGVFTRDAEKNVLPSAGIILNNNNNVVSSLNLEKPLHTSHPHAPERTRQPPQPTSAEEPLPYATKATVSGFGFSQSSESTTPSLPELTEVEQCTSTGAALGQQGEAADHQREGYCPSVNLPASVSVKKHGEMTQLCKETEPEACLKPEEFPRHETEEPPCLPHGDLLAMPRRVRHRQSYKTAVSFDDDDDDEEDEEEREVSRRPDSVGSTWQPSVSLEHTRRAISSSSLTSSSTSSPPLTSGDLRNRNGGLQGSRLEGVPTIYIQDLKEERFPTQGPGESSGLGQGFGLVSGNSKQLRHSLPLEAEYCTPSPERAEYIEPLPHQNIHPDRHHIQNIHPDPHHVQNIHPDPNHVQNIHPDPHHVQNIHPDPHHVQNINPDPQHFRFDPPDEARFGPNPDPRLGPRQAPRARLSSSHDSVLLPSSAEYSISDCLQYGSPRGLGWNSSDEELCSREGEDEAKVQAMLQRAKDGKLLSLMHRAEKKTTTPWHHSTGHLLEEDDSTTSLSPWNHSATSLSPWNHSTNSLSPWNHSTNSLSPWNHSSGHLHDDREEVESSEGSTSSVSPRQRPAVARRISSRLRSRMCRSLGADLDQPFLGEDTKGGGVSARRNCHLLSSSPSLRYTRSSSSLSSCATPPRCHSLMELEEGGRGRARRSTGGKMASSTAPHDGSCFHRQSLVPLEPREHAWVVKGASGTWTDIYSLFREDPSLLNRRDFISGYTVLHWIAKHGDHRVLNTLWYGVNKAGMTLDVDARSACGYTPLHLAAIHGHKKMMSLLVHKFKADVGLRDTAGKKPWQYLEPPRPGDLLQLLGAPRPAAGAGGAPGEGRKRSSHPLHHSSSSAERHRSRLLTVSGSAAVKRSSSIAAFLKHKSLLRFHGHHSDSSV